MKCDKSIQEFMYNNIILFGGNSIFPGMKQRLQMELIELTQNDKLNIVSPKCTFPTLKHEYASYQDKLPEREYTVWKGGAILSSLSMMDKLWITKQEYTDYQDSKLKSIPYSMLFHKYVYLIING